MLILISWGGIGSWFLNLVMYLGAAGVIWKGYQMLRKVEADKDKTESESHKLDAETSSIQVAAAKVVFDEWKNIAMNYKKDFEYLSAKYDLLEAKVDDERVECDRKLKIMSGEIKRLERMIK